MHYNFTFSFSFPETMTNQGSASIPGAYDTYNMFDPDLDEVVDAGASYGWFDNGMLTDQDIADYLGEDAPGNDPESAAEDYAETSSYKSILTVNMHTPVDSSRSNRVSPSLPVPTTGNNRSQIPTRPLRGLFSDGLTDASYTTRIKASMYVKKLYAQLTKHYRSLRKF